MAWTQEKIQEVAKSIQDKAMTDTAFRARFKANPNTVIEEVSGLQVPEGFKIRVIAPEDADLTIALPKIETGELNDNELEAVAGGKSHTATVFSDLATFGLYNVGQHIAKDIHDH